MLVLGGGGAKGAFQVGALRYLTGLGYKWDRIFGVSTGALQAVMMAQGDQAAMEDLWSNIKKSDIMTGGLNIGQIFKMVLGRAKGIYGNGPLEKLIKKHVTGKFKVPVHVGVVDLLTGEYLCPNLRVAGGLAKVHKYVLASTSIPVTWQPVEVDGKMLVDGGVRDQVPLRDAIRYSPSEIVVITCNPVGKMQKVEPDRVNRIDRIAMRTISIMSNEIATGDITTRTKVKIIDPDGFLHDTLDFDREKLNRANELGFKRAKEVMSELG